MHVLDLNWRPQEFYCNWLYRKLTPVPYTPQHLLALLCDLMWPTPLWLNCCPSNSLPLCFNTFLESLAIKPLTVAKAVWMPKGWILDTNIDGTDWIIWIQLIGGGGDYFWWYNVDLYWFKPRGMAGMCK